MKKLLFLRQIPFIALILLLSNCSGGNVDMMKLIAERDSLRLQSEIQQRQLNGINKAFKTMNETVDSIAMTESIIFINIDGIEVSRNGALSNLDKFEELIRRQDKKIKELEKELASSVFNTDAQNLVKYLNSQIRLKDKQIQELRRELEDKNVSIAQLRKEVQSQSIRINDQNKAIESLENSIQQKDRALVKQDEYINTGYVLIGSKDDLKRKGVINKKGALQAESLLNKSLFAKVDIRKWTQITFSAKKPRILSNVPSNSYRLTTNGKGEFNLIVINTTDFWNLTNYLIIQTN